MDYRIKGRPLLHGAAVPRYYPVVSRAAIGILLAGLWVSAGCPRQTNEKPHESKRKTATGDESKVEMRRFAPEEIAGWKKAGKDQRYGPRSIYTYLNGGAEVYLAYGLKSLFVQEYQRQRGPRMTLLIFDMGRAVDAYGIFSHERDGEPKEVGQDSDYAGGLLRFWRGRHFVSITCVPDNPQTKLSAVAERAMLALGKEVDGRIKRPGKRPGMLAWLPRRGLDERSVRYLHTHLTLGHHISLPTKNVLGLDRQSEVVVAEYLYKRDRLVALILAFADPRRSRRALAKLKGPELAKTVGPTEARVCGRVLAAVVGPGPASRRANLLGRLTAKIPGC